MSKDITRILEGWDFDPNDVLVRVVKGDDGREKLQLRIDMGLMQMEMDGRPDGCRPEGFESWLDYYRHQHRQHELTHPDSVPFQLDDEDCAKLLREGIQYYHRYLSFWHLARFDLCARDTKRNLELFSFVRAHARSERNKLQFDQWRPYVTMMHTRSVATPLVIGEKFGEALRAIEWGIEAIRDFLEEHDQADRAEELPELVNLERWRDDIVQRQTERGEAEPEDALQSLRRRLQEAVADERFEEAARLRDEIRRLTEQSS